MSSQTDKPTGTTPAEITNEEWWLLYDLVAARHDQIDRAEYEVQQGLGSARWAALKEKLRERLGEESKS